jgi:hypothetical protein
MELLQVLRDGRGIPAADGASQRHDFPVGFDALEDAFAESDQHGTRLVRRYAAVREHGETDAHQARNQVAGHGCSGVVEHFVLGLDLTDVTAKVTYQLVGDVLCGRIPLDTPVNAPKDLQISNGRTKGV